MNNNIVPVDNDTIALLDQWLELERDGEQFPVPFDDAWKMAGYSTKASAKRALSDLVENEDFSTMMLKSNGGRASKVFNLTCDAFKSFCLMAKTHEGKMVRSYFIEAEKKWRLVQQVAPQVASEVEMMHLKIELAKIESQKALAECQKIQAESQILQFRHFVSTALPEFQKKEILGYEVIDKVEYRDRIVNESGYVLNDGATVTKKDLCKRLGFLTKNGAPDYKRLNHYLDKLPHTAFEDVATIQENRQLRRDWIDELERMVNDSDRQKWIGE
jgi:phage anti-repressor protein